MVYIPTSNIHTFLLIYIQTYLHIYNIYTFSYTLCIHMETYTRDSSEVRRSLFHPSRTYMTNRVAHTFSFQTSFFTNAEIIKTVVPPVMEDSHRLYTDREYAVFGRIDDRYERNRACIIQVSRELWFKETSRLS